MSKSPITSHDQSLLRLSTFDDSLTSTAKTTDLTQIAALERAVADYTDALLLGCYAGSISVMLQID